MTVVERMDFTCHVCGTQYATDVVASTNNFGGPPVLPPEPGCPVCGTPGRIRIGFTPGTLFEILFGLAESDGIPAACIERIIGWSTSLDDIDQWRAGFMKTRWERIIRGNLKFVSSAIHEKKAALHSAEPFGHFNILQHDAATISDPSEGMRRFANIRQPAFESWPQMNRDLRAMMDADPRIASDAEEVITRKWGGHAASYEHLSEQLQRGLSAKVLVFFEQAKAEFSRRILAERKRLSL